MQYEEALIIGKRRRTDAAAPGGVGVDDTEVLAAAMAADEAVPADRANREEKAARKGCKNAADVVVVERSRESRR
jgi:hypothetical protein